MSDLDLAIREFLAESYENLDQFERDLVILEANPREVETLSRIFRTVHSIKGACGFLAYPKLEAVSHAGEGLLSKLRDAELEWTTEMTSGLLALADVMRRLLGRIESTGQEGTENHDDLIHLLHQLQSITSDSTDPSKSADARDADDQGSVSSDATTVSTPNAVIEPFTAINMPTASATDLDTPDSLGAQQSVSAPNETRAESSALHESHAPGHSASVRVDVRLLDKLMNLVGELVLARNQVLQHASVKENAGMLATSQRLNLITTELQEGVMKTRMQPMGNVCNKFPRVVRDLALMCGKQVRFEMEGNETELDRTIIEAIKDPLTHLIRNSVDHGIEQPEERVRAGKSPVGCLRLRAFHESGQVIIEISDDGAGIDLEKVTKRGVEQGLITREQASRMADHQVMQLIFLPGFSTAERVTNISGRGVGMDVVKTNIEQIGGTIEMHSRPRQGTTFRIKIPLTLAIIPALIVKTGGESFAIPQVNLLELVRLEAEDVDRKIEFIKGVAILRLRGSLLPLIYLDEVLNLETRDSSKARATTSIVVLQCEGCRFGIVVDDINDTEEIVVKPLGKQLKGLTLFAGATIMGDGRVSLILDVSGIAKRAGIADGMTDRLTAAREKSEQTLTQDEKSAYLLLRHGKNGRLAIPLSHVSRLEEIPRNQIEYSSEGEVVQYRHEILPLIRLSNTISRFDGDAGNEQGPLHVVVSTQSDQIVGLVVDEILDIVEDTIRLKPLHSRLGLLGRAVIQDRVTDVVDVPGLVQSFGYAGMAN